MTSLKQILAESTLYTDVATKNALIKDLEKVSTIFFVNILGFLALKNHAGDSARLNSYFRKDRVQLSAITDDNGDLTIAIKLAVDANLMSTMRANELTKMLALIKQGIVTKIDENLLRRNLSPLTTLINHCDPKIRGYVKDFLSGKETLAGLVKPLYAYSRRVQMNIEFITMAKALISKIDDDEIANVAQTAGAPNVPSSAASVAAQVVAATTVAPATASTAVAATSAPKVYTYEELCKGGTPAPYSLNTMFGRLVLLHRLFHMTKSDIRIELAKWDTCGLKFKDLWNAGSKNDLYYVMVDLKDAVWRATEYVLETPNIKVFPKFEGRNLFGDFQKENIGSMLSGTDADSYFFNKYMEYNFDANNGEHLSMLMWVPGYFESPTKIGYRPLLYTEKDSVASRVVINSIRKALEEDAYSFIKALYNAPAPRSEERFFYRAYGNNPGDQLFGVKGNWKRFVFARSALNHNDTVINTIKYDLKGIVKGLMEFDPEFFKGIWVQWSNHVTQDDFGSDDVPYSFDFFCDLFRKLKNSPQDLIATNVMWKKIQTEFNGDMYKYLQSNNVGDVDKFFEYLKDNHMNAADAFNLLFNNDVNDRGMVFMNAGFEKPAFVKDFMDYLLAKNIKFDGMKFFWNGENSRQGFAIWLATYPDAKPVFRDIVATRSDWINGISSKESAVAKMFLDNNIIDPDTLMQKMMDADRLTPDLFYFYADTWCSIFRKELVYRFHDRFWELMLKDGWIKAWDQMKYAFKAWGEFPLIENSNAYVEISNSIAKNPLFGHNMLKVLLCGGCTGPQWLFDMLSQTYEEFVVNHNMKDIEVLNDLAIPTDSLSVLIANPMAKTFIEDINKRIDAFLPRIEYLMSKTDLDVHENSELFAYRRTLHTFRLSYINEYVKNLKRPDEYAAWINALISAANKLDVSIYEEFIDNIDPDIISDESAYKLLSDKALYNHNATRNEVLAMFSDTMGELMLKLYANEEYQKKLNNLIASFGNKAEACYKSLKDLLLIKPMIEEMMSENTLIKPEINMSTGDVIKVLKFNNFAIGGTRMAKKKSETYIEYLHRMTSKAAQKDLIIPEPKVKRVEVTDEEKEKISGEFYKFYSHPPRHGNVALLVTDVFDVDLQFPEHEEFKSEHPTPTVIPAFHGTGTVAASMILRFGFRVTNINAARGIIKTTGRMLGDGVYISNVFDKVSQYVGDNVHGNGITRYGGEGYIFEMEAYIGEKGIHHNSAGIRNDGIRSPEWCVFNARAQLKIKRAYRVKQVTRANIEDLCKKHGIDWKKKDESVYFPRFAEFYGMNLMREAEREAERAIEIPNVAKGCVTYVFMEGMIPVSKDYQVDFDDFVVNYETDRCWIEDGQDGFRVNIINDLDLDMRVMVPDNGWFVTDPDGLFSQYLLLLQKYGKKKQ